LAKQVCPANRISFYPVRNNVPLLPPGQRPLWGGAWAGGCSGVIHFRIIPAGFNAPLEFLTGLTIFVQQQEGIEWVKRMTLIWDFDISRTTVARGDPISSGLDWIFFRGKMA
jgi:hypothetical protein